MTKDKAQKRATRARMAKTGERYTTARLYALDLHKSQSDTGVVAVPEAPLDLAEHLARRETAASATAPALPPRVAEPGVSDEAVLRNTGNGWDEWFALLDAWDGTAHNHAEIARHVLETYGVSGWWAQNVTVGYERARGMRALHERPDGFSMSVSRTFPVSNERLFAAIVDDAERERWLADMVLRRRTSVPNKSARFDVLPDGPRLQIYFTAKGPEKASVAFQQERLADAREVERWKALWRGQFSLLAAYLAGVPSDQ